MTKHFHRELDKIKKQVLSLGTLVEERVRMTIRAMEEKDAALADHIIRSDHEIDALEVEVEEECLKVLALHQPVAVDLRFLVAVIKINNDLERIGDQAVNIAERVKTMAAKAPFKFVFDYSTMAERAETMLAKSLDALVNLDIDTALAVLAMDDEVDQIKRDAYDRIKAAMQENPDRIGYLINLFLISRHLERLADHATNIAEEVIYMIEGEIVRHGKYAL
jgi:phosphate transport system protein